MTNFGFPEGNVFQSTLPHGERPRTLRTVTPQSVYFNPRSRMGSDYPIYDENHRAELFQSTLPHGERHPSVTTNLFSSDFNPRSRMGSDPTASAYASRTNHFNPRSRMGSDGLLR